MKFSTLGLALAVLCGGAHAASAQIPVVGPDAGGYAVASDAPALTPLPPVASSYDHVELPSAVDPSGCATDSGHYAGWGFGARLAGLWQSWANPTVRTTWYAEGEALWLKRHFVNEQTTVIDDFSRASLLNTGDLDFIGPEEGGRVRVGFFTDCGPGVEVVYGGIEDWHASAEVTGDNRLTVPFEFAPFDYLGSDRVRMDYDSSLDSFEVNYVEPYGHMWTMAGIRYVELDERFQLESFDSDSGLSQYRINATNRMYGVQLGLRGEYDFYNIGIDFFGKAGLYANATGQNQELRDFDNTIALRRAGGKEDSIASLGEMGVSANVPLTEVFKIRVGYNLLVMGGLALGPDQLDFSDTPDSGRRVNDSGQLLAHGPSIGIEGRW